MKKTKQFAYKVVKQNKILGRDQLKSVTTRFEAVIYKLNRITRPTSSYRPFLFVFKTREQARRFRSIRANPRSFRIYKAEVTNMNEFRPGRTESGVLFQSDNFPAGTRFVDTVKLIKQAA